MAGHWERVPCFRGSRNYLFARSTIIFGCGGLSGHEQRWVWPLLGMDPVAHATGTSRFPGVPVPVIMGLSMKVLLQWISAIMIGSSLGWGQLAPAGHAAPLVREWTSDDGKKITAEYLGKQDSHVVIKQPGGKVSRLPLEKLSRDDQAFVRNHDFPYHAPWQAWPAESEVGIVNVMVSEAPGKDGAVVYTTPHFRFRSTVNLGAALIKELARVFELTHYLHSKSPFGILAKPADGLFDARLFGTTAQYRQAGGLPGTAGIYLHKEQVFLLPLDLMGLRPGGGTTGWRKSAYYDPTNMIHELTHMLTHDMLDNLPIWASEGYAEYISRIPIEKGAFKTGNDRIRQGIRERFIREYEQGLSAKPARRGQLGAADGLKLLQSDNLPKLYKVEKILMMTDQEWATGIPPARPPQTQGPPKANRNPPPVPQDRARMLRLYRTAHLILYYFIQIEGEKGVAKFRRFLDENRKHFADYQQYLADYRNYTARIQAFMNLPGVTKLPDGRVSYPAYLRPPAEPKPPFTDPNMLKMGGIGALLDGESAAVVGARIENALIEDLGAKLRFQ